MEWSSNSNNPDGARALWESRDWERCIYRVPWCLMGQGSDNHFKPRLIAIGPYHHFDPRLQSMNFHKFRILHYILNRNGKDGSVFINAIRNHEREARACYEGFSGIRGMDSDKFLKMLALDGCFILNFLQLRYGELPLRDYERNDPLFSKDYLCRGIEMDMMLLENQIPLFILIEPCKVTFNLPKDTSYCGKLIVDLMFKAFHAGWVIGREPVSDDDKKFIFSSSEIQKDFMTGSPSICLGIFWESLTFEPDNTKKSTEEEMASSMIRSSASRCLEISWKNLMSSFNGATKKKEHESESESESDPLEQLLMRQTMCVHFERPVRAGPTLGGIVVTDLKPLVIPSVTALKEAGVVLKYNNTLPFWRVKFEGGVLEIPQIMIHELTESIFLNLMAHELCHIQMANWKITTYVLFMDCLVNSASDVAELRNHGIIVAAGPSDEQIASLFNRLGNKRIFVKNDPEYGNLSRKKDEYCKERRHRWRANLMRNYFNSPWAIISVIVAAFLMLLTIVQTYYTVSQYYQKG